MYDIELAKKIIRFIPNEGLMSIYKSKNINKLGVKCLKLEDVKENRENLLLNLFKPINKKHFEKWLFEFYKKHSTKENKIQNLKENVESSNEEESQEHIITEEKHSIFEGKQKHTISEEKQKHLNFYNLVRLMYEGELEDLEKQLNKLELTKNNENTLKDNKQIVDEEMKKEVEKISKKLIQKIEDLNRKIVIQNEQFNKRVENYENEIKRLKNINKDYQKENQNIANEKKEVMNKYNVAQSLIVNKEKEIEGLKSRIKKLEDIDEFNRLELEELKNTIYVQAERLKKVNQKEIIAVGYNNLFKFENQKYNFNFVDVQEIAQLNSTEKDIWIIKCFLTPQEQYYLESMNLKSKTRGNLIVIEEYTELVEKLNEVSLNVK